MLSALTTIHILVSILLIIIVLLQFGKGAETGLMDAASQGTSFGVRGNLLTRITTVLAIIFLGLSLALAKLRSLETKKSYVDDLPTTARPLNSDASALPPAGPGALPGQPALPSVPAEPLAPSEKAPAAPQK